MPNINAKWMKNSFHLCDNLFASLAVRRQVIVKKTKNSLRAIILHNYVGDPGTP